MDAFSFFLQEFYNNLQKQNLLLKADEIKQFAQQKWEQLDIQDKEKYYYLEDFQKRKQQDNRTLEFQINYCYSDPEYKKEAQYIEQIIQNAYPQAIINLYLVRGNNKAVSVLQIQQNKPSKLVWHSCQHGHVSPQNHFIFHRKLLECIQ